MTARRGAVAAFGLALVLLGMTVPPARAVDVSSLSDIESDPCFQQAHQRALDHHLGVIESQIVAACTDAHGNPTEAMALLTERAKAPPWLPPAAGGLSATAVLLAALAELVVVAILLGVDVGYSARALAVTPPLGQVPGAVAILAARLVAAAMLTLLVALPGLTILMSVGLLILAIRVCRWRGPSSTHDAAPGRDAGRVARAIAMLGTDLLANAPVTLGIAAVARGSIVLALAGVLVAAGAARLLHPGLGQRMMRRPVLGRAAGGVIAWIGGMAALSDPAFASLGPPPLFVIALVPAGLAGLALVLAMVLARGHRAPAPLAGE